MSPEFIIISFLSVSLCLQNSMPYSMALEHELLSVSGTGSHCHSLGAILERRGEPSPLALHVGAHSSNTFMCCDSQWLVQWLVTTQPSWTTPYWGLGVSHQTHRLALLQFGRVPPSMETLCKAQLDDR